MKTLDEVKSTVAEVKAEPTMNDIFAGKTAFFETGNGEIHSFGKITDYFGIRDKAKELNNVQRLCWYNTEWEHLKPFTDKTHHCQNVEVYVSHLLLTGWRRDPNCKPNIMEFTQPILNAMRSDISYEDAENAFKEWSARGEGYSSFDNITDLYLQADIEGEAVKLAQDFKYYNNCTFCFHCIFSHGLYDFDFSPNENMKGLLLDPSRYVLVSDNSKYVLRVSAKIPDAKEQLNEAVKEYDDYLDHKIYTASSYDKDGNEVIDKLEDIEYEHNIPADCPVKDFLKKKFGAKRFLGFFDNIDEAKKSAAKDKENGR